MFLYAFTFTVLHIAAITTGMFDEVTTELGYESYAEKINSIPGLSEHVPMPINTLVNIGYFLVGIYWFFKFRGDFWGEGFATYSMLYSGIQTARMLAQSQRTAVLDQWITTTIFCHAALWIISSYPEGAAKGTITRLVESCGTPPVILVSFLSYVLRLLFYYGFDVSLALHILVAVRVGYEAVCSPALEAGGKSRAVFPKGGVCCVGGVVLRVADLPLREWWTPNCLAGSGLPKICGVGQIHYTAQLLWVMKESGKFVDS
eukprot:sb/3479445/